MCTVNIKIDNEKVRRINPNLKNNENIERWVQYCMDEFIDTLSSNGHKSVSPNAHSVSEMREILQERIPSCGGGRREADFKHGCLCTNRQALWLLRLVGLKALVENWMLRLNMYIVSLAKTAPDVQEQK